MKQTLAVKQKDGSVWGVPVTEIAESRADYYKSEFDGDLQWSLAEDTLPLFEEDEYEIQDWAVGNMNWSDFKSPFKISDAPVITAQDFEVAWMSADKELI